MRSFFLSAVLLGALGCSTGAVAPVKTQAYAKLKGERNFEYELPQAWRGIEAVFREYKVTRRDPEQVSPNEERKLTERSMDTDWIYSQSRDKYQEYRLNDLPRKKYLQTRIRYHVRGKAVMGSWVQVRTEEEIEKLNGNGTSAGYGASDAPDPSRADEILSRIQMEILKAPPIQSTP